MDIKELLRRISSEVDQLTERNKALEKINDLLGERVICPFGSGIVPAGAVGIITNYSANRRAFNDTYEAVGVTFFPVAGYEYLPQSEHWFPVKTLNLPVKADAVPGLMYYAEYRRNKAKIEKIAGRKLEVA